MSFNINDNIRSPTVDHRNGLDSDGDPTQYSSGSRPYYNQPSSPVLNQRLFGNNDDNINAMSTTELDSDNNDNSSQFQYDPSLFTRSNNKNYDQDYDYSKLWEPSTSAPFMTNNSQQQQQFGDDPSTPTRPLSFGQKSAKHVASPTSSVKVVVADNSPKGQLESYKSNILSIINLLNEYVLSHPFIVIRRQAQVNNRSEAYHLTPFTVIPFMFRIQTKQGFGAFFKGLPSVLVNYVLVIGGESLCYNMLGYPIEFDFALNQLLSERLVKHLLLKSLSILLVTPFICSGSVETVQSLIVNDSPSPFESIKEGFLRIFHFKNDRKFFIHQLIVPSVLYHISYYLIYSLTKEAIRYYFFYQETTQLQQETKYYKNPQIQRLIDQEENEQQQEDILHRTTIVNANQSVIVDGHNPNPTTQTTSPFSYPEENQTNRLLIELKCSLYANIITDVLLYPFQTVLYRVFLQGTRTLIDNVDGRTAVMPLISQYDSVTDCYQSIIRHEGSGGLFKGFGALILQYAFQASIIQLANICVDAYINSG